VKGEPMTQTTAADAAEAATAQGARLRRDFAATLGARQELGGCYDDELIDDFLRRLDHSVDAHIEQTLNQQGVSPSPRRRKSGGRQLGRNARLLIAALVLAVPLFAGSASFGAFVGIFFGVASHHWLIGLVTAFLVTVGTFSAVALVLAVGALIYLDRRRA
jgi:hypothetical protein